MSNGRPAQFFPILEQALKEYGEPMHYTDLSRLVEIPEKNVCTALAHHTRNHPMGSIRRVKRGTYLYVGTAHTRLAKIKAAQDALPRREPLPADQPPLFKGAVSQEEIQAKTHPAQRSVPEQLQRFGDTLTADEKNAFREAVNTAEFQRETDLIRVEGYAAPSSEIVGDVLEHLSIRRGGIKFPPPLAAGLKLEDATVVHVDNGLTGEAPDVFFTWRGKLWKAFQL